MGAEGSFFIILSKSSSYKLKEKVILRFSIAQHSRDEALIRSLIQYLDCGKIYIRSGGAAIDFKILKFDDFTNKLIPFFKKYPIIGPWL